MMKLLRVLSLAMVGAAAGCGPADADDASPYELPPHDGCTLTQAIDPGTVHSETHAWTYDHDDYLASYRYTHDDAVDEETWAYDADGCVTEYTRATHEDGDEVSTYTVSAVCEDGLPVSEVERWAQDGEVYVEARWAYTHVVEGGKPTLVVRARESGGVERIAQTWHDGELVSLDGWWNQEWRSHQAWTLDEEGRVLEHVSERPDDPAQNTRETYVRDEHGRFVEWTYGTGTAYEVDSFVETRTWQEDILAPLHIEDDERADGIVDVVYDWDCTSGWPWSCEVTVDVADDAGVVDGEPDEVWDYGWTCP